MTHRYPFLRPRPPSVAPLLPMIEEMERSRRFSNFGPFETELEARFDSYFGAPDSSLAVCNATLGLMLAIRLLAERRPGARYALMPSFTFAATGQAAIWAGLEPMFCDIDPCNWLMDRDAEARLIERHADRIAILVPCATFGSTIDIDYYTALSRATGIPVVIDAAASLGALEADGTPMGARSPHPVVFSMHATKTFSVGEGGLVHCADRDLIASLRAMSNFGFTAPRSAALPGLNAKLGELMSILALAKFDSLEDLSVHRAMLAATYRSSLPDWPCQVLKGRRQAYSFMPLLVPDDLADERDAIIADLAADGIECGRYFVPHMAEQPIFRNCPSGAPLQATGETARRIIAFPLWDEMNAGDVLNCCEAAARIVERLRSRGRRLPAAYTQDLVDGASCAIAEPA